MSLHSASRGTMVSAGAIVSGGLSAALFAVALMHVGTMIVFLAYIAGLPLFIAGLGFGNMAGIGAAVVGAVGLYVMQSPSFAMAYTLLDAAPAILLIILAMRHRIGSDQKVYWYPEGFLMTALALYPCLIFISIVALTWDQSGGLLALTINTLQDMVEALKPQMDADVTLQLSSRVDVFAKLLPAFTGCAWMIITMLCFALSQNILAHFHKNVRTSFSLQELHIPTWMVLSVALTGLLGMMAPAPYNYIGLNLSIMLGTPFVFVGLAVVHAWALTTKSPKIILTIFYVLASMIVWSVLVVATLGVIDQWFNFRQRLAIRPKAHLS